MCRRGDKDAVLALRADDGQTVWETQYDAPAKPGMALEFGPGPHSTPLIVGDRMFTVGAMVQFRCLDKHTGKILWSHDLMDEMGASHMLRGYGASPIAYKDLVIINVGHASGQPGVGVAAFKQDTGEVVWKNETLGAGYASPILVKFNGEDHLIVALGADRAALDPATGQIRWHATVDSQSFGIMATPIWIEPDMLFCSAGYGGGTRLFKIEVQDGQYVPTELWHYRKMQVVHGVAARVGDVVYASSHGSFGPALLMAIDLKTGKPLWRQRSLAKANLLYADGKFIILDEEGVLALATATPEGLDIRSQAKVLERLAWTVPTLVGSRLYLRDERTIKCLDLGAAANQ
jgi:outer membrane protein assembly factor BamB